MQCYWQYIFSFRCLVMLFIYPVNGSERLCRKLYSLSGCKLNIFDNYLLQEMSCLFIAVPGIVLLFRQSAVADSAL